MTDVKNNEKKALEKTWRLFSPSSSVYRKKAVSMP